MTDCTTNRSDRHMNVFVTLWCGCCLLFSDGIIDDPVYPLVNNLHHMSGLALEPNPPDFALLSANLKSFPNYVPLNKGVTPKNIVRVLRLAPFVLSTLIAHECHPRAP